jgi:uncharacterized membrane protein YhfC
MQVNIFTVITLIGETLVTICLPLLIFTYYSRKQKLSFKPLLIGIIVWLFTTQILEKAINFLILIITPIPHIPIFFSLYAAGMTGILEETGRFIAFQKLLPQNRQWKDGISYGIGHGGIESIVIGGISGVQLIIFAWMINMGNITILKKNLPPTLFIHTVNTLYSSPILFLLASIEQVFAFIIQMGLSLLVLLAVRQRKINILLYAIILHIVYALPSVFYQTRQLDLLITEISTILFGIVSIIWIKKSKKLFSERFAD